MPEFLTEDEARKLVDQSMEGEQETHIQEIVNEHPKLKGRVVHRGKVSRSIHGGPGMFRRPIAEKDSYLDLLNGLNFDWETVIVKEKGKDVEKMQITYENPQLQLQDGRDARIMVRGADISTHDIERGTIPFKDQVLAENHAAMLRIATPFIGTSQLDIGSPSNAVVILAEQLEQIRFENVYRAFMAKSSTSTSLYMHYVKNGKKDEFCGHQLPPDLVVNGPLRYIIDTPSTKAIDHDESVSSQYLFDQNICTAEQYQQIRNGSLATCGAVAQFLMRHSGISIDYNALDTLDPELIDKRDIIFVDTKFEHGINSRGQIVSQDEIATMDSSRYWLLKEYVIQFQKFLRGEIEEIAPTSYSKEFARDFSEGEAGYDDDTRAKIAVRYIQGIQHLLGKRFEPDTRSRDERVVEGLEVAVQRLAA